MLNSVTGKTHAIKGAAWCNKGDVLSTCLKA